MHRSASTDYPCPQRGGIRNCTCWDSIVLTVWGALQCTDKWAINTPKIICRPTVGLSVGKMIK